jgi:hypothetical protein
MLTKIFIVLSGVALLVVPFHAQQATPITGTITAIEGNHIEIKDQAGKPVIVMLDKNTRYVKSDKAATKSELKVGTVVVIDVKMDDKMKMLAAKEVTIRTAGTGKR